MDDLEQRVKEFNQHGFYNIGIIRLVNDLWKEVIHLRGLLQQVPKQEDKKERK